MRAKFVNEDIRFERGKDPKEELNIGRDRKVKKGDKIPVNYKGKEYIVTAASDESEYRGRVMTRSGGYGWGGREPEYESRTFKEVLVYDKNGNICKAEAKEWWDNEGNTIWPWEIGEYEKPVLESVNFERGKDPKKALNIGKDRKLKEGDKIKVYNAWESDYWDAVVTMADYKEDPGWTYGPSILAYFPELDESYPITWNQTFDEWMIAE
jgi:hypothetical protein